MPQIDAGNQYLRYRTTVLEQRETVRELVTRYCPDDSADIIDMLGLDEADVYND